MKIRYNKHTPLLKVESPKVGGLYHVEWGKNHGVVGRCTAVDLIAQTVLMCSPKSKQPWKYPVPFSQLRHTRKTQHKISLKAKK